MVLWREDNGKLPFPFKTEMNRKNLEEFFFMYEAGKVKVKYEEEKI